MKFSLKSVVSTACVAFVYSCADTKPDSKKEVAQAPAPSPESAAVDDSLPEATVLRVKLDQNGNVVKGSESLRVVATTSAAANISNEYANGADHLAVSNIDELDNTSSTQSWSFTRILGNSQGQGPGPADQNGYPSAPSYPTPGQNYDPNTPAPAPNGQTYPDYQPQPNQSQCGNCPQQSTTVCTPCGNEVEHRQGPSTAVYPVSRKTVYEHRTTDVYPTQYVDVYPVETVRVHPTQVVTNVHPVAQQVVYVGNHCQQVSACGYAANYFPTVSYNNYTQYYHYQSYSDVGGYRYFRYCRPRIFGRHGW